MLPRSRRSQRTQTFLAILSPHAARTLNSTGWKYGSKDDEAATRVDIRSLYRHEHIVPENLIKGLYRQVEATNDGTGLKEQLIQQDWFSIPEAFGNDIQADELEKQTSYYAHANGWSNRLIQGDSLLVMNSLLNREGMAGQVQCIYIDPPYGIKYGSNWQIKLNNRTVKDGDDDSLSGEPEQVKAFRDTWELGIHSYLSYLRDRLLVARDLLHQSGSCFVQISDENVHLVRAVMDEVFGSGNFSGLISVEKTSGQTSDLPAAVCDFLVWYAKDKSAAKVRKLFAPRDAFENPTERYVCVETPSGQIVDLSVKQKLRQEPIPEGRVLKLLDISSQTGSENSRFPIEFGGKVFRPSGSRGWSTSKAGIERLIAAQRLHVQGNNIWWKSYRDEFPFRQITSHWSDAKSNAFGDPPRLCSANEQPRVAALHPDDHRPRRSRA